MSVPATPSAASSAIQALWEAASNTARQGPARAAQRYRMLTRGIARLAAYARFPVRSARDNVVRYISRQENEKGLKKILACLVADARQAAGGYVWAQGCQGL